MRLINQLHPVPLKSLASLLERLRQTNYYEEASWFRSLIPPSYGQLPNLLRAATHYRLLADLTGLAIEQLQMLTLHRFVPFYYPPEALLTFLKSTTTCPCRCGNLGRLNCTCMGSSIGRSVPCAGSSIMPCFSPGRSGILRLVLPIACCSSITVTLVELRSV